jgi:hypothetical protein
MKAAITAALALALIATPILAGDKPTPLPASVMTAKTVFLDNQTGHDQITDRATEEITKWGRFTILKEAKDADLIFRFTADTKGRPTPPHNDIDISPTPIILSVVDQANNVLWFASRNKPFHSQTRLDIQEFKKRIEDQEKGK